ncbi:MAG: hypothetical protein RDV48_16550 [Candidatus Eremiobacteraeota bacterium]|nr:hypothetical protein [Candidatus Eremiobacteraeota bacterium]
MKELVILAEERNECLKEKDTMLQCRQHALFNEKWSLRLIIAGYSMFLISLTFFHISIAILARYIGKYNISSPLVTRLAFFLIGSPFKYFLIIMVITIILAIFYRRLMSNTFLSTAVILVLFVQCSTLLLLSLIMAAAFVPLFHF